MNTKQYFTSAVCRPYNIPTPTYPTLSQAPWTETESSAWPCTGELSRGQFTISIGTHLNTVHTTCRWCYYNKCQNNIYSEHAPSKISDTSFSNLIKQYFPFRWYSVIYLFTSMKYTLKKYNYLDIQSKIPSPHSATLFYKSTDVWIQTRSCQLSFSTLSIVVFSQILTETNKDDYSNSYLHHSTWVGWLVSSPSEELDPVLVLRTVRAVTEVDPLNEDNWDEFSSLIHQNLWL